MLSHCHNRTPFKHKLTFDVHKRSQRQNKNDRYWSISWSPPLMNCVVTALLFGLAPEQLLSLVPIEIHEERPLDALFGEVQNRLAPHCMTG